MREPKDSPRRQQEGVYSAEIFGPVGKRVQIIFLDTRYFRSPLIDDKSPGRKMPNLPDTNPDSTILGKVQWNWLEEQLRQPAEIRLLISSIQVISQHHGGEKWMNFPLERERLFKMIRDTKANGVIILSGDRHFAELSVMDGGVGYPIYDFTSSGLNRGRRDWRYPEFNPQRVQIMHFGDNFGLIEIDWEKSPRVSLQIRDIEGDVMIQQKFPLKLLQPVTKP
jgi:alkaline phosphatase D